MGWLKGVGGWGGVVCRPAKSQKPKKKIRQRYNSTTSILILMADVPKSVTRALDRVRKFREVPVDWKADVTTSGLALKVEV